MAALADLVALRTQVHGRRIRPPAASAGVPGGRAPGKLNRGMEFAESRPYRAGDDVRSIDWRQTARRGVPFTKLFREEHERPVHLLVDLGPSMRFGTRVAFKSVTAARAAALLAWQAVENGDRVGGIVFGSGHREVRPQGRHQGALALLRQLADMSAATPDAQSSLATALPAMASTVRPGGICILVSDFQSLDDALAQAITALSLRNDVALVQVSDVFESAPPQGLFPVSDGTRGTVLDLRSDASRTAWLAPFAARRALLDKLAHHPRIRLLALSTEEDPACVLRLLAGSP
ncbi:DUF58 domain-containing protein [Noviherbaspirillum denitrificans]|uniref:DUF58 domain-containing protein n=1 Tax=Noviherbaspirillum denitrificans TaxID=1968433 RepID=A0A254TJ47_9BURK|nr:DUF58 domain-containing protein [Noviherbaspirillum denitrificans]OWW22680.1 hypothetical protein AYR66_27440 [Noviherbaspirillum denitrificans]